MKTVNKISELKLIHQQLGNERTNSLVFNFCFRLGKNIEINLKEIS